MTYMPTMTYYAMRHSHESYSAWFYISAILVALLISAIVFGYPIYVPFIKKIVRKMKAKTRSGHKDNRENTESL